MSEIIKIMKRIIDHCRQCDHYYTNGNFVKNKKEICKITGKTLINSYEKIPDDCPLEDSMEVE